MRTSGFLFLIEKRTISRKYGRVFAGYSSPVLAQEYKNKRHPGADTKKLGYIHAPTAGPVS